MIEGRESTRRRLVMAMPGRPGRRGPRTLRLLVALLALGAGPPALAQTDPLPSWNDGPARQSLVRFVQAVTDAASPQHVPPAARIAVLD
ncbi:MAG: hypothetical protein ABW020_11935, partial [Candidatus Rokuibacteriota bacterium]